MKIATIVGARPQFIKAATISRVISIHSGITEVLIHTGQHFDTNMSDVFFKELDIRTPDYRLGIGGGSHGQNTGRMLEAIEQVLLDEKPNWVLVYGDTDSTIAGALAAAKLHINLAHVEAGLRSFNRRMPEEINRVLTDHSANLLFAPTQTAVNNLLKEGISENKIHLVGDVMYDATLFYKERARKPISLNISKSQSFYLCTIHRAENTIDSNRLSAIVELLNQLSEKTFIVMPLHPRTVIALEQLGGKSLSQSVKVISPVSYLEMTWLLENCQMVITDSGGLQKEAYFHKKLCATLRKETEWLELVDVGWNKLFTPGDAGVAQEIMSCKYPKIDSQKNLYGDGDASSRIVQQILGYQ